MPLKSLLKLLTSLKLTVVFLSLGMVLVFIGTLAQVEHGLYIAQQNYFQSFFVTWTPEGTQWSIPVFPGGYLIGSVLLVNLIAAHAIRFELSKKKIGLFMIHAGLILLLLGQLFTDLLSVESNMRFSEGEAMNYSESPRLSELAIIDTSGSEDDKVVAIPESVVSKNEGEVIEHPDIPFKLKITDYMVHSLLTNRAETATEPAAASQGIGQRVIAKEMPPVVRMDMRSVPSSIVEIITEEGSQGTWLVSGWLDQPQLFNHDGKTYQLAMRLKRYYKPYWIQLLDFSHDKYKGTEIPKNYSSRVKIINPTTDEEREVLIYMNHPLRYEGETYYQSSFDKNDPTVSILQVVRNPTWLTPYVACTLVGAGLLVQFLSHLVRFAKRRMS